MGKKGLCIKDGLRNTIAAKTDSHACYIREPLFAAAIPQSFAGGFHKTQEGIHGKKR
jgi:hypothetical protein